MDMTLFLRFSSGIMILAVEKVFPFWYDWDILTAGKNSKYEKLIRLKLSLQYATNYNIE